MPKLECAECGKVFRLAAASLVNVRLTCSMRCKNRIQLRNQRTSGTKIEQIVEAELVRRGWPFESQAKIDVSTTDFYLPAIRTAIYCDGTYWHSLPGVPERDARIDATLRAMGYAVVRLSDSDILRDAAACLDRIKHPSASCTSGM